ncbi:MAG TPA: flagellar biosynthesis protein FliQ [Pirellulales bacterium]
MNAQDAIDLGRQAMLIALLASSPVLGAGLIVGLIVGLLQALTQIQEQTVAFVPKLLAMMLALSLALPWLLVQMTQYLRDLFTGIPDLL